MARGRGRPPKNAKTLESAGFSPVLKDVLSIVGRQIEIPGSFWTWGKDASANKEKTFVCIVHRFDALHSKSPSAAYEIETAEDGIGIGTGFSKCCCE